MLFLSGLALGQSQISLYQMGRSIPQANQINPAFIPSSEVTIGLPILSSAYVSFDTPLAINDMFSRDANNNLVLNNDGILDALANGGRIDLESNISLLFVGIRTEVGFFSLGFNGRVDFASTVPGEAIRFIFEGNGADPTAPVGVDLGEINTRGTWFNELALGYSREVIRDLTVGGKFKFLRGVANGTVDGLNGSITTNIDSIHIQSDPWAFHTAGQSAFDSEGNLDARYFLFGSKNTGWAVDLGAQYVWDDRLRLSLSVLDLGRIKWREDTKSYLFDGINYTYTGADVLDLIESNGSQDPLGQELDSLEALLDPTEVEGLEYKTNLTGSLYAAGDLDLTDKHAVGVILYGDMFQSRLNPAVGLSYTFTAGKIFSAGVNTSYRNKNFGNFGAALALKLGPVQLYGTFDSFASVLNIDNTRAVSARLGLNLMFNSKEKPGVPRN